MTPFISASWIILLALATFHPTNTVFCGDVGIVYGRNGDTFPSPKQAICNLYNSVKKAGIDYIYVTTAVGSKVLGGSYPPSTGQFPPKLLTIMNYLTSYLCNKGSLLLINVYPYYALTSDPKPISLDYALFQSQTPVFKYGNLEYYNPFDAMVDSFMAAMTRVVQTKDVKVVVVETSWPTGGSGLYDCLENARIYNQNVREHAINKGCTPRKANINLEVYIYEMFNENIKDDQCFGIFNRNLSEAYPLWV